MRPVTAPLRRHLGHSHGPIENDSLHAGGFRALLDEAGVDFLEEARTAAMTVGWTSRRAWATASTDST